MAIASFCLMLAAVSCDGGSDYSDDATPTNAPATAPATPTAASASPTALSGPNESGSSPVFWRTSDDFGSVTANEGYLVLFRIDSGFNEQSLTVTAICADCDADEQTFLGTNSPPIGADSPGSYYPIVLTFPEAGYWELTVHAGPDEVTIPIDVQPGG
jgi:hypothetical protein